MSKKRQTRTAQEKFKIVMEGLRGDHGSIAALCNAYGITQTDFYRWRDILMEDGSRLFERGGVDMEHQRLEDENHKLREAVGSLTMELKKRLVMAARKRRSRKESEPNVKLLEMIRGLKCDHPSWGYKRVSAWLRKRGHMAANHKRVPRLMKADGLPVPRNFRLRATRRNRSTERAKPKTIEPNRFRGTDMTKIMLPQSGWAYLHIVIDWGDKKLLAAHPSRTSKSQDWIAALEQAVASEFPQGIRDLPPGYGVPELVSDHGSQPASAAFRGACDSPGIGQIFASHGNPRGNADTERMMRTIKEDLVYPNDFQTFNELETELKTWMKRYNEEFLHSTLGYESPLEYENWFYHATRREPPLFGVLKFFGDSRPVNVLASLEKGDQYTPISISTNAI